MYLYGKRSFPIVLSTFLTFSILFIVVKGNDPDKNVSKERLLSVFNVVRFRNGPCTSSPDNMDGVCYTAQECNQRGGKSGTQCAEGFGVCCLFNNGCGLTSNENSTYFSSESVIESGERTSCNLRVCPCTKNVCQLRLDFIELNIAGPTLSNDVIGSIDNGKPTKIAGVLPVTKSTRCETESFSVSNPGGNTPPVICGVNTGQHMYVDASESCNDLNFFLDGNKQNTNWNIKVTQFLCSYENLAPKGCTQYYFGSTQGSVSTYNFDGGLHLANQNQNICIRKELGQCRICWNSNAAEDFQLSGTGNEAYNDDDICCNQSRNLEIGFDCVKIPLASESGPGNTILAASGFCGSSNGLAVVGSAMITAAGALVNNNNPILDQTICSRSQPFSIKFVSDDFETLSEAQSGPNGFRLQYKQEIC